ncbi:H-2 class II histocompatibility antigen E-S beta chain-like [Crotalus adamanteus]|uniref:H-2 class II histocompatibility antigen E-S beta chain-like n=1 Tax=Crotalus adamanteus TaxID=8729 RepID=A0AAW1BU56_CROAD
MGQKGEKGRGGLKGGESPGAWTPTKGESRWDRRFPIPPPGGAFRQSLAAGLPSLRLPVAPPLLGTMGPGVPPEGSLLSAPPPNLPQPYGTRRVRFLERLFYDRQEFVRFDSARGEFEAVTALGKGDAEALNRDERLLDAFCRYNYEALQGGPVIGRRAKPTVSISPTKLDPASPNTILLCIARGFYPVEIEVQWLKNGRPKEEGVAFGEELQNGDWTYQLHVLLETQPQRGDVYTCQVEHASLEAPITVPWELRSSNSARSKLWTGIVAAVIGVIFFAMGLSLHLKSKKAIPIQPPAALMN